MTTGRSQAVQEDEILLVSFQRLAIRPGSVRTVTVPTSSALVLWVERVAALYMSMPQPDCPV